MRLLAALLLVVLSVLPALAVRPDEMLADKALEARARAISAGLRCLVCQNQSIEDSDADLARDLRVIVRERLTSGDTDKQAVDYIVARYGEYVLLNPVVAPHTLLLWFATPVVLLVGGAGIAFAVRRKKSVAVVAPMALSAEEQAALDDLERPSRR
jgi:cytochrome c-type biogenesis protein CcmH